VSLERPSKFWRRLGETHEADLAEYGFENVKRHQALRYFTWSWSWRRIRGSVQMRFLLRHSGIRTLLRNLVTRGDLSDSAWTGVPWSKPDRWLYVFATRLLWRYASAHGTPSVMALSEPNLGNPFPVQLDGRLISQDLANTALEVRAIERALAGRAPRSILEVGAGYGRTAYALLSIFPEARYIIADIPPAIDISRWYLTSLFPAGRLEFLRPDEVDDLGRGSVDLALSISSLQEMTPEQVDGYLRLFDRVAAGGTIFLKQWDRWQNPEDGVEMRFDDYPFPARWRRIFRERASVQTSFGQAGWTVPA